MRIKKFDNILSNIGEKLKKHTNTPRTPEETYLIYAGVFILSSIVFIAVARKLKSR